jgi:hypothetical protein
MPITVIIRGLFNTGANSTDCWNRQGATMQSVQTICMVTCSVAANRVVFGRTLNGVLVVGNGSTVVVTFANDGSMEIIPLRLAKV